jgi:ectoine hydroxylase-related dioxygenase (phytanoyl-CoA dioxygenase family)
MISERDVASYRENGYIVVPEVLDGVTLSRLRDAIARALDGAREVTAHTAMYDLEPGHRPDAPRVRRLKTPHRFFPDFEKLYRDPRVVGIVQQLLGPAVRLHGSKINLKAPRYGSPVEWHQDWAFYPHTNDDLLAVGVMLDDCMLDNGPLLVVPGTHTGPVYDHHADGFFCGAVDPAAIEAEIKGAVPMLGPAGSMSFHHVRALHGSAQNVSDRPRALLLYEYAAADAWPLMGVADFADFSARLITGAPTIEPRLRPAPVRMPVPPARHQGSIYENQTDAARRYFAVAADPAPSPGTLAARA